MQIGDIYLADLGAETRLHAVVASNPQFGRLSGRVFVVPEIDAPSREDDYPWRITSGATTYAADRLKAVPHDRLLRKVGALDPATTNELTTTLQIILS